MPRADPFVFDLYLCNLSSLDADDFIVVQPDYYGEQGGDSLEALSTYGFMGRPLDPDVDGEGTISAACPMLVGWEGGKGWAIPLLDKRSVAKLPALQKGESIQYGPAANFVRCHADGSVTTYTTTNGELTGQAVQQRVRQTEFIRSAPWGLERFDATGYHLRTHSGARLDIGGIGGVPAPLDSMSSYARLTAAMVELKASIVKIGVGPDAEAVVKADALVGVLGTIATALTALQASIAATPTGGAGSAAPVVAAVAAIGSAKATISSRSMKVT